MVDPAMRGFLEVVRDEGVTANPWMEALAKAQGLIRWSDHRKGLILTDRGEAVLNG